MKGLAMAVALLLCAAALTACGGKGEAPRATEAPAPQETAVPEAAAPEIAPEAQQATIVSDEEYAALEAGQAAAGGQDSADRPVDLDLTQISGTVVYSQVYDMLMEPEVYLGQKVKMRGSFNYYQDPETKQEYFATVIQDATACCAQGIEFVWKGEHTYPRDYPKLNSEITVCGTFETYDEAGSTYIQLADADVTW